MSETNNNESSFIKKAAAAAGIAGAGGLLYLGAQAGINMANANDNEAEFKAEIAATDEHKEAILDTLDGHFMESQQIGNPFKIVEDQGALDPALVEIEREYPNDFSNIKPLIYDDLKYASQHVNPQPGESFVVVETDVDPEANNGNEYLPVREQQIVHTTVTELPTPETH